MNKIQRDILSAILKDRNITLEALAEKVGISVRNIEKNIARLKEEGLLKRIGSRKTGYWEIESNMNEKDRSSTVYTDLQIRIYPIQKGIAQGAIR